MPRDCHVLLWLFPDVLLKPPCVGRGFVGPSAWMCVQGCMAADRLNQVREEMTGPQPVPEACLWDTWLCTPRTHTLLEAFPSSSTLLSKYRSSNLLGQALFPRKVVILGPQLCTRASTRVEAPLEGPLSHSRVATPPTASQAQPTSPF